jgi:Family of unknown function (DUF6518)
MGSGRKLGQLLLAGIAFGVLVAAIKGQNAGVRDTLGNTSAPWVLVPFLAGTRYSRVWCAALVGVATTVAAFFGFYLAEAAILDLGAHPWYTDLRLTLGSGHLYETWGLLSGSIFGALGGVWASRSLVAAPIAVGLAFICEPLIVLILVRAGIWGGGGLLQQPSIWITEVLVGLVGIAFVVAKAQTRPTRARR